MSVTRLIHAYLHGKTTSYRLNAYDDAAIADLLIAYITAGTIPSSEDSVAERARRFIEQAPASHAKGHLVVTAFTLKHLNGMADLMWARHLEQWARLESAASSDLYADYETGPINLFFWSYLWQRSLHPIHDYALAQTGRPLELNTLHILAAIAGVQEANIAANHANRGLILSGQPPAPGKIQALHECSRQHRYPRVFLKSAADTQAAASYWDRVFVTVLYWRFNAARA